MQAKRKEGLFFSGAEALIVVAILVLVNVLAHFAYARFDLSSGRLYSLSDGSQAVLGRLKDQLLIKVYFTPHLPSPYGLNERYLDDLLGEYKSRGRGLVRVELLDPDKGDNAQQARQAGIATVQMNVMSRDKFEVKDAYMGVVFFYRGKTEVLPVVDSTADLEYQITSRIKKLVSSEKKTLGLVSGHGEKTPDNQELAPLFAALREDMDVQTIDLAKPLPQPAPDALWVFGPTQKFKPEEISALKGWLASGKSLGIMMNRRGVSMQNFYATPQETGLEPFLESWGLKMSEGFVVDALCEKIQMQSQVGMFTAVTIQEYPYIPIATRFDDSNQATRSLQAVSFPFVHAVSFTPPKGLDLKYVSLADSSKASWVQDRITVQPGTPIEQLETKNQGPFSLAGEIEGRFGTASPGTAASAPGHLIVVGTANQLDSRIFSEEANGAFLLNLIEWSFQDQDLLSIRSKSVTYRPLRRLSDVRLKLAKYLLILFLPLALLAAAALVYRRQKALREMLPRLYADA